MITIIALLAISNLHAGPCEISSEAVMKYEQRILSAIQTQPEKIDEPLKCLLEIQMKAEGMTKYFAHKFLRPLLGGQLPALIKKDPRYDLVAKRIEKIPYFAVNQFAHGDWGFYKMFCEEGDTSFCATMVPDEDHIQRDKPLLAAASILKLRQAYLILKGEQRQVIAARIKNLYQSIPSKNKIQREFIEQVYHELFGPTIPLSMA